MYHSPKQGSERVSKEVADNDGYTFFLHADDPAFINDRQLYWFSSEIEVAKSHADYWPDAEGNKWRLTLKCLIPENSLVADVRNYHSVVRDDIVIIGKIWWR